MNGALANKRCVPAHAVRAPTLTDQEKKKRACERARLWRKNNPEKKRQANLLWERNNPDKSRESKHKWSANNKEKRSVTHKAWRANNRDRYLAQKKKNYEKHRAARLEYARERSPEYKAQYEKNNPEKRVNNEHIRRARKRQVAHEVVDTRSIFERDGWICQLCSKAVDKTIHHPDPLSASLDHIIPLSKGGSHMKQNVQLAHLICNVKAHTKTRRNYGKDL